MIEKVSISNFKSIKNVEFKAKRINLLIGEPNVGKSNILEALALASFSTWINSTYREELGFLRYNRLSELFNTINEDCQISLQIRQKNSDETYNHLSKLSYGQNSINVKSNELNYKLHQGRKFELLNLELPQTHRILPFYLTAKKALYQIENGSYLEPPYGLNLTQVIFNNDFLIEQLYDLLMPFGLEATISEDESQFFLRKSIDKFKSKLINFDLLAETYKRFLFYLAAIQTNKESTLLFEEPESKSFPTYISSLANEIIDSSNQFFIVTHSPYLYDQLISTVPKEEINILKVGFEDYSTTVKEIAYKDYAELNKLGVDVFFNLADL